MSEPTSDSSQNQPPFSAPVLLTGATGFIGRHIQRALLDAGQRVRIVLRPQSPHRAHADPRSELIECSLEDTVGLARAVSGVRAVVYCAGSVRGRRLEDFLPANVDGVQNTLEALSGSHDSPPFLLISSLAASRPELSHYASSKHMGEQAVLGQNFVPWTILRPPAVYGPGDVEMLPVLKMARRGLVAHPGPADQRLSLLYCEDLATAVRAWLDSWPRCAGMTCAIDDGRSEGYDWPAIIQACGNLRYRSFRIPFPLLAGVARFNLWASRLAGYAPMLTPGKVRELTQPHWLCDNTAFVQATGWQPRTGLACGVRLSLGQAPDERD